MAARAVALDISKAFERVCHAGVPHEVMKLWVRYWPCFVFSQEYMALSSGSEWEVLTGTWS